MKGKELLDIIRKRKEMVKKTTDDKAERETLVWKDLEATFCKDLEVFFFSCVPLWGGV